MRNISFTAQAYSDYLSWLDHDKKIFDKINDLIKEAARHPYSGTGKPEPLKHHLKGYWSRRINKEHRLVYKVSSESITVISCKYHYK